MSTVANWSYANEAVIWPQGPRDPYTREPTWGEPFLIACTFAAMGNIQTDANGQQFVPQDTIWHEDQRAINAGDRVVFGLHGQVDAQVLDWAINVYWPAVDANDLSQVGPPGFAKVVRKVGGWDMSFFNDSPDFVIYT